MEQSKLNEILADPNNWLQNLCVGDKVVRVGRTTKNMIVVVDRVTTTQILIGGERYRRSDGIRVGNGAWDNIHIEKR